MNKSKKLKIVACIQARMGSTRLSGKVLKTILDKSLVEHERDKLMFCREVDQIVLTTSINKENDILAEHAKKIGLSFYRGNEMDLISRYIGTISKFDAEAIVRITADCPMVDPKIVDKLVKIFRENAGRYDFVTNIYERTFPKGLDVEVLSADTIRKLDEIVKDPVYREIFTSYIMQHPEDFKIYNFLNVKNLSDLRWTVDYQEDFDFVANIYKKLYESGKIFIMKDILLLLMKEPKLTQLNNKWIG